MINHVLIVGVLVLRWKLGYGFVEPYSYSGLTKTHHVYQLSTTTQVRSTIQIRTDETAREPQNDKNVINSLIKIVPKHENDDDDDDDEQVTCRIVARADGKLILPQETNATETSLLTRKQIDQIYNAEFYKLFKSLPLEIHKDSMEVEDNSIGGRNEHTNAITNTNDVQELRKSLEQSGFRLWKERDLYLCEALNQGYLLRLSIQPDIKDMDPNLGKEFYPDLYEETTDDTESAPNRIPLLYDGRILIFTRGYSQEITKGRLLLAKFDYLQSSLVQRLAFAIARKIGVMEAKIKHSLQQQLKVIENFFHDYMNRTKSYIPLPTRRLMNKGIKMLYNRRKKREKNNSSKLTKRILKLGRYVGNSGKFTDISSNFDALDSFLVCENEDRYVQSLPESEEEKVVIRDLQRKYENNEVSCRYDLLRSIKGPSHLLKRVSVANLIDVSSSGGKRQWMRSLFSSSKLIEPTYEEVCIIWRPLPSKRRKENDKSRTSIPNLIYYLAELFDFVEKLPGKEKKERTSNNMPIEIRMFDGVPMANLQAVFPKTKLIFRPADALILDAINTVSLLAVLASQRFDSPKLDVLALVSVSLWIVRTFFRYSNKIARYDLLVNKFLTSRISHRNRGAAQYILNEAAKQRSLRASLVFEWLQEMYYTDNMNLISRNTLLSMGQKELNSRLRMDQPVNVDINAALTDLSVLNLIEFNDDDELSNVLSGPLVHYALLKTWTKCFEEL